MEDRSEKTIVVFSLFGELMGFDISYVREILAPTDIHPLPNVPDFFEGVIKLRNHTLAVIDLRKRFIMKNKREREQHKYRIIVCRINEFIIGLIVDSVIGVLNIDSNDMDRVPDFMSSDNQGNQISGIANIDEKVVILLNIDHILSRDEKTTLTLIKDEKS